MYHVSIGKMCRARLFLSVTLSLMGVICGGMLSSDQTCFNDLGCFPYRPPWVDSLRPLPRPRHPDTYHATLVFYARNANPNGTSIRLYPEVSKTPNEFKAQRSATVFIFPGTAASSGGVGVTWPNRMKDAILKRLDANVFIANNTAGTINIDKFLAAANAPVFAKQYTGFINNIKATKGLDGNRIWIIGFSDGAHIAGFVGKETHIARITGLDPAQELYQGHPPEVRLDRADADYVDVVHSDSRPTIPDIGEGIMNAIGHVDFYLNGADQQPGCHLPRAIDLVGYPTLFDAIKEPVRLIAQSLLCAHKMSHRVFIAALEIDDCTIWGHPGTYENFLRALSNAGTQGILSQYTALKGTCDMTRCVPLGFSSPQSSARGIFIITTDGFYPYCMDQRKTVSQTEEDHIEVQGAQWVSDLLESNKQDEEQDQLYNL